MVRVRVANPNPNPNHSERGDLQPAGQQRRLRSLRALQSCRHAKPTLLGDVNIIFFEAESRVSPTEKAYPAAGATPEKLHEAAMRA